MATPRACIPGTISTGSPRMRRRSRPSSGDIRPPTSTDAAHHGLPPAHGFSDRRLEIANGGHLIAKRRNLVENLRGTAANIALVFASFGRDHDDPVLMDV